MRAVELRQKTPIWIITLPFKLYPGLRLTYNSSVVGETRAYVRSVLVIVRFRRPSRNNPIIEDASKPTRIQWYSCKSIVDERPFLLSCSHDNAACATESWQADSRVIIMPAVGGLWHSSTCKNRWFMSQQNSCRRPMRQWIPLLFRPLCGGGLREVSFRLWRSQDAPIIWLNTSERYTISLWSHGISELTWQMRYC